MNESIAIFVGTDPRSIRLLEIALRRFRLNLISIGPSCGLLKLLSTSQPRLVVIDVEAPGVDRDALIERIRGEPALAAATVLLYMPLDEPELARQAAACGADGAISRMKDAPALRADLARWLSRA